MSRVHICHCVDNLNACGAQQVVRLLVDSLDRTRYESVVYTFDDGPLAAPMRDAGVLVRVLSRRVPKFDPGLVDSIRRHLLEDRIEILHMHLFGSTLHGTLAATIVPSLFRVVSLHSDREDNLLQRMAYPVLFSLAHSVVGVSHAASRKMALRYRTLRGKLTTIPNGIDTKRFQGAVNRERLLAALDLRPDVRIVGTVGRLSREKGHTVLLNAFRQVSDRYPDAILLVVGDGGLRESLARQASELGIESRVRYVGARGDVPELLRLMNVFVLSSLWEGLPLVLLEAMAAGVPVVSTRVGGIPEVIDDQQEGLLVPVLDADALAAAVIRVLADPHLAARLRVAAVSRVSARYTVEHMVSRHEALYATLRRAGVRPAVARRGGHV